MEKFKLSSKDVVYLRELATKQFEISQLPIMEERAKIWTNMNDGVKNSRPPFVLESWTFDRDFMPQLQCESKYGKSLEKQFLRNIRHHEVLNDDHVCPDFFRIPRHKDFDEFGIEIQKEYIKDYDGEVTGYHVETPIKDLYDYDLDQLKPSTIKVDMETSMQEKRQLEEYFGDIIPIEFDKGSWGMTNLTQRLVNLMDMETFFLSMYDCPEKLHQLMGYLRDNAINISKIAEEGNYLALNNKNQNTCGSCFNFTTLIPNRAIAPNESIKLSDMWGVMDSQEAVGVSPELFNEFIYPYYEEIAKMFGLVYYGCCEPVAPLWEDSLSKLPNLKTISISKWCDQEFMAEALSTTNVVYSRKPDPNLLGVEQVLNEDAWRNELATTLNLVSKYNVNSELIVRDVYTLHGNLDKARRAVEIAKEEIDKIYN